MSESLVLFDNAFSPYAFRVRATLYETGIEHEKREMRDHRLAWCFRLGLGGWLAREQADGRLAYSPLP